MISTRSSHTRARWHKVYLDTAISVETFARNLNSPPIVILYVSIETQFGKAACFSQILTCRLTNQSPGSPADLIKTLTTYSHKRRQPLFLQIVTADPPPHPPSCPHTYTRIDTHTRARVRGTSPPSHPRLVSDLISTNISQPCSK